MAIGLCMQYRTNSSLCTRIPVLNFILSKGLHTHCYDAIISTFQDKDTLLMEESIIPKSRLMIV